MLLLYEWSLDSGRRYSFRATYVPALMPMSVSSEASNSGMVCALLQICAISLDPKDLIISYSTSRATQNLLMHIAVLIIKPYGAPCTRRPMNPIG